MNDGECEIECLRPTILSSRKVGGAGVDCWRTWVQQLSASIPQLHQLPQIKCQMTEPVVPVGYLVTAKGILAKAWPVRISPSEAPRDVRVSDLGTKFGDPASMPTPLTRGYLGVWVATRLFWSTIS
jgi:hypothetical protein